MQQRRHHMTARIENTVHSYLLQPFTFLHPKKADSYQALSKLVKIMEFIPKYFTQTFYAVYV